MEQLMEAARVGNIDGLYAVIQSKPEILKDIDKKPLVETPLHVAASFGWTHFALEMMSLKPSFGRKLNPEGLSPLHLALKNQKFHTVKGLISFDSELIRVKGREMATPLHYAAENDLYIEFLALFLYTCPASISDLTIRGENALHIAVKNFNRKGAELLLEWLSKTKKSDLLHQTDENDNTVLHTAVSTNQSKIVELLLNKIVHVTAILNEVNNEGLTALDIASRDDIKKLLRRANAKPSSKMSPRTLSQEMICREQSFEAVYKIICFSRRDLSVEMVSAVLVVAVLIATATLETTLHPPADISPDHLFRYSHNNKTAVHSTTATALGLPARISTDTLLSSSTTNNKTTTCYNTTEDDPLEKYVFKGPGGVIFTYRNILFVGFYVANTIAFAASILVIIIVLPWRYYSCLLHWSLVFVAASYGFAMFLLEHPPWIASCLLCLSYGVPLLAYYGKQVSLYFEKLIHMEASWIWLKDIQHILFLGWIWPPNTFKRCRILKHLYK